MSALVNPRRVRKILRGEARIGPVVYWMQRDQRVLDNWALLQAQQIALERKVPLIVVFCLVTDFLGATSRQYGFMLAGLREVERELRKYNIHVHVLAGDPGRSLPEFVDRTGAGSLVTDYSPLRIVRGWKDRVRKAITIPFFEVDAHNIIPYSVVSDKLEYAAHTIRPKIHRHLEEFLDVFPEPIAHPFQAGVSFVQTDWERITGRLKLDTTVGQVAWLKPGEAAAWDVLRVFLDDRLAHYAVDRNNPARKAQSDISPYLHFGNISAQRIALEVAKIRGHGESRDAFLEELVVRRELADNFCQHQPAYDSWDGFPPWARRSLEEHLPDPRPFVYRRDEFETARTHDELWNAAQREMVQTGKMHGYMRMYWAKKILEWSPTPREAIATAIYLNDRYELDGRDPNGYAGIAWSIGGVHDRAWFERSVFGKIRYMSAEGCKRKFDVAAYIQQQNR